MVIGAGYLLNQEVIQPKIVDKYFVAEKSYNHSTEGNLVENTHWRLKTPDEREWYQPGQEEKDKNFNWIFLLSVTLAIVTFLGFRLTYKYYLRTIEGLDSGTENKVLAFSIIPAVIITSLAFLHSYNQKIANFGFYYEGIVDFFFATVLLIISWIFIQYVAVIITGLFQGKDSKTIDLVTEFIHAKKEKVCPLIEYRSALTGDNE